MILLSMQLEVLSMLSMQLGIQQYMEVLSKQLGVQHMLLEVQSKLLDELHKEVLSMQLAQQHMVRRLVQLLQVEQQLHD